jgi:Inositol monophosphatase family
LDGYYMRGVRPWDLAAGSLIVREGGGKLTDYRGEELALDGGEIVASNGRLHSAITRLTGAGWPTNLVDHTDSCRRNPSHRAAE